VVTVKENGHEITVEGNTITKAGWVNVSLKGYKIDKNNVKEM
jgi:hypothetical protein